MWLPFIDSSWVYMANGHPFPDEYRQPVLADEIQTFKALITIHKVLQEGHPVVVREGQQHVNWVDSLMRGVAGEGIRGMRFRWEVVRANATTSVWRRLSVRLLTCWMHRIRPPYSGICFLSRVEISVPPGSP